VLGNVPTDNIQGLFDREITRSTNNTSKYRDEEDNDDNAIIAILHLLEDCGL
jgi:hypothetical protein